MIVLNRGKYLVKNTLLFALANFGTKFISFFLVPLYTNALSKEEYGTTDLIFTICSFVVPFIILNINEAILRFALDKSSDSNSIMSAGFAVLLFSLFEGALLAMLAKLYKPIAPYSSLVYFYAVTLGMSLIFVSYLRGKELLFRFAIGNILQTLFIALFNILFLLVFRWGIKGYLLAYISANLLTSMYAFIAGNLKDVILHFNVDKKLWIEMVKYAVVLIPNSFMWWIMNSLDRVMLTSMVGVGIVGIYAVSNKIPSLLSVATSIFNQAYSYSAIKENDSADRESYNNKIYDYFVGLITIFSVLIMMIIRAFIKIYVSEEFYSAWEYAPPLIVGTAFLSFATLLAMSYIVNKDSKGFLYSSTIGSIVNIVLNYFLIPSFGAMGAAIATCVSYITVLLYRHFNIKKYLVIKTFSVKHLISYGIILLSGILVYMSTHFQIFVSIILLVTVVIIYKDNWKGISESILKKKSRD